MDIIRKIEQENQRMLAIALLCGLLLFRAACFISGLRYGLATLARLRKLNLINWVGKLKMVNAVLTALVIWHLPISRMGSPRAHRRLRGLAHRQHRRSCRGTPPLGAAPRRHPISNVPFPGACRPDRLPCAASCARAGLRQ